MLLSVILQNFVVLHTKGGAVRWFKVSPVAVDDQTG